MRLGAADNETKLSYLDNLYMLKSHYLNKHKIKGSEGQQKHTNIFQ